MHTQRSTEPQHDILIVQIVGRKLFYFIKWLMLIDLIMILTDTAYIPSTLTVKIGMSRWSKSQVWNIVPIIGVVT